MKLNTAAEDISEMKWEQLEYVLHRDHMDLDRRTQQLGQPSISMTLLWLTYLQGWRRALV